MATPDLTVPAGTALGLTVALLVGVNLLNNRYARSAYLPTSALATAALLGIFALTGLPWAGAGLGADRLAPGLAWGLALAAAMALVYLVGVLLPLTRGLFRDRRVERADRREIAYQTLVRIPLATVALEEVAFRGVLYGLATQVAGVVWATVLSSLLFGLWHVLPSLGMVQLNQAAGRAFRGREAAAAVAAVAATAAAGVLFCEIRRRTGSLLPVVMLHWAVNALGYLAALFVTRRAARS